MTKGPQDFEKLTDDVIEGVPCMLAMPAGTGKTHLLVTIAGKLVERGISVLVLTHTNAGISAIRSRCLRMGINPVQLSVATISSWAERAALVYCGTSRHDLASDRWVQKDYYSQCVGEALTLLGHEWFANVIGVSYQAVLVDEYQDCSLVQHRLVKRLAALIPRTICFGDPLQRIFDFAEEEFPDWDAVRADFHVFEGVRPYPYRWTGRNMPLGEWLT